MAKRLILIGGAVGALLVAVLLYSFLRPTAEASAPIEAPELVLESAVEPEPAPDPPTATAEPVAEAGPEQEPEAEANATEPAAASEPEPVAADSSGPIIYEIVPTESQARYIIDEVLRGAPTTVIGTTDQIAGQLAVDPSDPTSARLGTMIVNARTFVTDEERRDRAVRNRVLSTDAFEFITFEPVTVSNLPASAEVGQPYTFQVTGQLTIRDVTREVTWDVSLTPNSSERLEGTASTSIQRGDFGLQIPSVPFVADVSEQVRIEVDFVALAQSS